MDLIFLKSLRPLYCDYISRILCVRRAQQRRPPRPPFMYFYSRPYARGDTASTTARTFLRNFYSRPYARGDRFSISVSRLLSPFLLAPLREGRPFLLCLRPVPWPFLLAPLREGRHGSAVPSGGGLVISTHAPTRGATNYLRRLSSQSFISTHAPTRGATSSRAA